MPFVARQLVLTYNGLASNDTGYHLHGRVRRYRDANNLRHQYQILVQAGNQADFITRYLALEAAFAAEFKDFVVTHGGTTTTYSQSDNSGLNISAEAERALDEDLDGEWSRLYDVRVDMQLPRSSADDLGLVTLETRVRTLASGKLLVELSGSMTAVGGNNARAQYASRIATIAAAEQSELGITHWDQEDEDFKYDRQRNLLSFSRRYREMLTKDSLSTFNSTKLSGHRYAVSRTQLGTGDSIKSTRKPIELVVFFEAKVNKDEVLGTQSLHQFYVDEIEPLLVEIAMDAADASTISLKRRTPNLLPEDSEINVTLELSAYADSNFLASVVRTIEDETVGIRFVGALDGNPHSAHILPAQGSILRQVEQQILFLNEPLEDGADGAVLNGTLGSGSVLGGGGNPGSSGGGLLAGGAGGSAGVFGVGGNSPGLASGFNTGVFGVAGAGGAGGGKGGSISASQVPRFGSARGGSFVPFRQVVSSQPIWEGLEPYQVLTTQYTKTTFSFYVATPKRVLGGPGGRGRGGAGGGSSREPRSTTGGNRGGKVGPTGGGGETVG